MIKKMGAAVLAILLIVLSGAFFQFQSNLIQDIRIKDGRLQIHMPEKAVCVQKKKFTFSENRNPLSLQNISIFVNDKLIAQTVYQKSLRYYLPVNLFPIGDLPETLRGEVLQIDGQTYLSINDIEQALNLESRWDYTLKTISMRSGNPRLQRQRRDNAQPAMIRLEDFTAGGALLTADICMKYKIFADYLYQNNVKFHVAWIPRFVHPSEGIDNDLMFNDGIENVGFVNLMDHLINRGAVIGLHGYTHQYGESVSAEGNEISKEFNTMPEEMETLVKKGLQTAAFLNIPIDFFESPHYKATKKEQNILSKYFKVIYEPYQGTWNLNPLVSHKNNTTIFMPTPLGYVHDRDGSQMVRRLKLNQNAKMQLSSFYFHRFLEFEFIHLKPDGYSYNENSPMHRIVKALKQYGYETVTVKDFTDHLP